MIEDRKALENLVIDNPDLERLEALLDEFNIFEVLGAVRAELRHSEFLAFLMNPKQNHGLGDGFVKKFLQRALQESNQTELPITPIDLDVWSLDELEVRREWHHIDILLVDEEHNFVVIVENKIDSKEHSNQLERYYQRAKNEFPTYAILAIYLTPEGSPPSKDYYDPISYDLVVELIENFIRRRSNTLGPDVLTMMKHYAKMLRRFIVSGSEIEQLAQKIYKKHQRAMDMILEHKPDIQASVKELLLKILEETNGIVPLASGKTYIRFTPAEWDIPILNSGSNWADGRILAFEFVNNADQLRIKLTIGPGEEDIRKKIFDMSTQKDGFKLPPGGRLGQKWGTIYMEKILSKSYYTDVIEIEAMESKIRDFWEQFLVNDLERMKAIVVRQDWYKD